MIISPVEHPRYLPLSDQLMFEQTADSVLRDHFMNARNLFLGERPLKERRAGRRR